MFVSQAICLKCRVLLPAQSWPHIPFSPIRHCCPRPECERKRPLCAIRGVGKKAWGVVASGKLVGGYSRRLWEVSGDSCEGDREGRGCGSTISSEANSSVFLPGRGKTPDSSQLQLPVHQLQWKHIFWYHIWLQQQPSLLRPPPVPRGFGKWADIRASEMECIGPALSRARLL